MLDTPILQKTREELHSEVWSISVSGMSKKYDIPYDHLMRQLKAANIPTPSSGYWTRLSYGKKPEITALTGEASTIVSIFRRVPTTRKTKERVPPNSSHKPCQQEIQEAAALNSCETEGEIEPKEAVGKVPQQCEPEVCERYGNRYNIYDREVLYQEVWEQPVTEVAKKYRVSDVVIHKICKSLKVPTPPAGYWAKLRAGKEVKRLPMPQGDYPKGKEGLRLEVAVYSPQSESTLSFLDEENRQLVLAVAAQILLPEPNERMHPTIIAHRNKVTEWQNKLKSNQEEGWGKRNMPAAPLFADTISDATLPRVCRLMDALIKALEPLGCTLSDDLKFIVNGECVSITATEATDQIAHVLTKEENLQMLTYEDARRRRSYASKPNIRKYDHIYNGRITVGIHGTRLFRDNKSSTLEERLGEMVIALYEASDTVRQQREEWEEKERQRQEETRKRELRRTQYNHEVEQTEALVNAADDFAIACKIRAYVAAVEALGDKNDETTAWIEWAKKKADWYDPVIARKDAFFGVREHKADASSKEFRKTLASWRFGL